MFSPIERKHNLTGETTERAATLNELYAGKQFVVNGMWSTVVAFEVDPTNEYRLMVRFARASRLVPASKITAKNLTAR